MSEISSIDMRLGADPHQKASEIMHCCCLPEYGAAVTMPAIHNEQLTGAQKHSTQESSAEA